MVHSLSAPSSALRENSSSSGARKAAPTICAVISFGSKTILIDLMSRAELMRAQSWNPQYENRIVVVKIIYRVWTLGRIIGKIAIESLTGNRSSMRPSCLTLSNVLSILGVCLSSLLAGGCCHPSQTDCIPNKEMPYAVCDGGAKYYLTDHLSINQMIRDNYLESKSDLVDAMKKRFPDNQELSAYLDARKKWDQQVLNSHDHMFRGIEADLKQSGGELYEYMILGKRHDTGGGHIQVEVEEGWLILSKGKVRKEGEIGSGDYDEDYLKLEGIEANGKN
jgi:hypothetical protein